MSKGVILEINGKYAVVLTKEGSFERTLAPKGVQIGEEIPFEKTVRTPRPPAKWVTVAACLVLGFGTWSYWNFSSQNQVYAYVGIDINPSLELGINHSGKVLIVQALNDDAKSLLSNLTLKGQTVDQAVATLAKAAAAKGFVHQDADIVITASPAENGGQAPANTSGNQAADGTDSGNQLTALEENLVASAQKTFASVSQNVHVDGLEISSQFHTAAAKLGLPPAKYAFYLKANSDGHPVTIEQLKTTSISKLEADLGLPRDFLKGETAKSLDVALQNSDQPQLDSQNPPSTAPAGTDANVQNAVQSGTPPVVTQPPSSGAVHTPGASASPRPQVDSESDGPNQHANFLDVLRQRLHLKAPAKEDQSSQQMQGARQKVPAPSSSNKDQSRSKTGSQDDQGNQGNQNSQGSQNDQGSQNQQDGDHAEAPSDGPAKASGNERSDKSKSKQSDSRSSSEKEMKQTVSGSQPIDLNVGVTVYDNENSPTSEGLLGVWLRTK